MLTEDQIKHMVSRFLGWKLPANFSPDGGVSFSKTGNTGTAHEYKHEPTGTNLLDADQAEAMVRYIIKGMSGFKQFRRKQIAELRPYVAGEALERVSVSAPDREAGSPKPGDMIARNPKNHDDQWLVAAQYFADNFEAIT